MRNYSQQKERNVMSDSVMLQKDFIEFKGVLSE